MTSRMRMFAGPNGSGKTSLKSLLPEKLIGYYINPDEIELEIARNKRFSLLDFGVSCSPGELLDYMRESQLLAKEELVLNLRKIKEDDAVLDFRDISINSYYTSVISDFIRQRLLLTSKSFTCETVMSHVSKVELLKNAQRHGYRTYLYYVCTNDPDINLSRVHNRGELGGHSVPEEKIRNRYVKSLELLLQAIQNADRAYIFDNSAANQQQTWLAEVENEEMEIKVDRVPAWFQEYVLDKIS